ncbi:MAG: substrate-binding domain-containing protein [Armatimonadia bacterium]
MPLNTHLGKAQQVASAIEAQIASGAFRPGTLLPAERTLAGDHGVARNTVRAALDALEQDGLIRHEGRRGAVVCASAELATTAPILLVLPSSEDSAPAMLSPEATALIGQTLCACGGSSTQFRLQSMLKDGRALVRKVREARAAGVLLIECHNAAILGTLQAQDIPHVVVNQEYDVPGPATRVDFRWVGREAARYLLALGHRRLGVLSGPAERDMYEQMLAGLRGRCAESEVYLPSHRLVRVRSCSEASREAALSILSLDDRPTALFCTRDIRAYGAYLAARDLGLRVPEDLSLVGYDDITWPGEGRQLLTTFPEPASELGGAALRMLSSWISTGHAPADAVIRPELVVRASTGPACL